MQRRVSKLVERFAPGCGETNGEPVEDWPLAKGHTLFVTRHKGAAEWAARQGVAIDRVVEHLDLADVRPGDTVIGTLPVHLAAEVCERQARYLHLAFELPVEHRGIELTPEDMVRFGARLVEHRVLRGADL